LDLERALLTSREALGPIEKAGIFPPPPAAAAAATLLLFSDMLTMIGANQSINQSIINLDGGFCCKGIVLLRRF
jgi:hypothetical protein